MHASYTGWLLVLYPATSFGQGLIWQTAFAATLWLVVAVVMLGGRSRVPAQGPGTGAGAGSAATQPTRSLLP
jgi:hypothetical protein